MIRDKIAEGYEFAFVGVLFFLSCIPLIIIYVFSKKKWELKLTLSMMFIYLIVSFLGTKIPVFIVPILALIFLGILVNRTFVKI